MIDKVKNKITLFGKTEEIKEWKVWFATPFGLIESIDDAAKRCIANDLEPALHIRPMPVAIGETLYEVGQ